jgi:hypothetical protein
MFNRSPNWNFFSLNFQFNSAYSLQRAIVLPVTHLWKNTWSFLMVCIILCSSIKGFALPNCRLFHTIEKNIFITVKNWWFLTYGQVYIYMYTMYIYLTIQGHFFYKLKCAENHNFVKTLSYYLKLCIVSEWFAIFKLYRGKNKLILNEMMMMSSTLYYSNTLKLDIYSASSLKQQSADRHVAPLCHIILIPSQPVFTLTP